MIEINIPIRFADVDAAGIVYYPRYFHFFHVAMEEFFDGALGIHYSKLVSDERMGLPTVHVETDFVSPLRYGDVLRFEVRVGKIGTTSVEWFFEGQDAKTDRRVVSARTVTVYSDLRTLEKRPVPQRLRELLEGTRSA